MRLKINVTNRRALELGARRPSSSQAPPRVIRLPFGEWPPAASRHPDHRKNSDSHSPRTRRVCSSCSSSATLLSERRTSSANGACGRQARHDNDGMRPRIADHGWRSRVRRSTAALVRQAGQRTHKNQCRALSAQPIVGENSIGMRLAYARSMPRPGGWRLRGFAPRSLAWRPPPSRRLRRAVLSSCAC